LKIQIRKYDERLDSRIIEYQPDCTIIRTAGGKVSSLFNQSEFRDIFTPDCIWVALNEDKIIGAVLFGRYNKENPHRAAIYGIWVDEPYRRRGSRKPTCLPGRMVSTVYLFKLHLITSHH